MKRYIYLFIFLLPVFAQAQMDHYYHSYVCASGHASFLSVAPIETIGASTSKAACVINTETKQVDVKIPIRSFNFDQQLMQDHFNDNYLESDKYPNAVLTASIVENIDLTKDGVYDVTLKGKLEIHGVIQERIITGKITVANGAPVRATAGFKVALEDYKINVPMALSLNIADEIHVAVDFNMEKFHRDELISSR